MLVLSLMLSPGAVVDVLLLAAFVGRLVLILLSSVVGVLVVALLVAALLALVELLVVVLLLVLIVSADAVRLRDDME